MTQFEQCDELRFNIETSFLLLLQCDALRLQLTTTTTTTITAITTTTTTTTTTTM